MSQSSPSQWLGGFLVALLVVGLGGCSGGGSVETNSSEVRYPTAEERSEWRDDTVWSEDGVSIVTASCRVRWPGIWTFGFMLDAPEDVEFPIRLGLRPRWYWTGDDVASGTYPFEVTVTRPGMVEATVHTASFPDVQAHMADDDPKRRLERWSRLGQSVGSYHSVGAHCQIDIEYSRDTPSGRSSGYVDVALDLIEIPVTAPEGSLQRLAQSADVTDSADPRLLWAHAHGTGLNLVAERVWLLPDAKLARVREKWFRAGSCHTIVTTYEIDTENQLNVHQIRGCLTSDMESRWETELIEVDTDTDWRVFIQGSTRGEYESLAEQLISYDNLTQAAPPHRTTQRIGRLDWDGEPMKLIWSTDTGVEHVYIRDREWSASSADHWNGCWLTQAYDDGFALVVVADPTWLVSIDGQPIDLGNKNGFGAAIFPWPDNTLAPTPSWISQSDTSAIPCG